MGKLKAIETQESLVVEYLGYLRVPAQFRKRFGTPKNYPDAQARFVVDEENNEVRLTYIFDSNKLVSANKKRRKARR